MKVLLLALALAAQDDAAVTEAIATYDAAFPKAKDAENRAAAVGALAQTQHEKIIPKLEKALSHADKPVRLSAVQGLKAYSTAAAPALKKSATKALIDGLAAGVNAKDIEVREASVAALGALQDESAVPTVKTAIDDKSLKVSVAAVQAAVSLKSKDLIEPLIGCLRDAEKTLKAAANPTLKGKKPTSARKDPNDPEELKLDRATNLILPAKAALETLTGQTHPDGEAWARWWTTARPNFVIKKD